MKRSILAGLLAALVLTLAGPVLAGSKLVEILPGRYGFTLQRGHDIYSNDGKWMLNTRLLVKGPRGRNGMCYTLHSEHRSFEDTQKFLEFLQQNLTRIRSIETKQVKALSFEKRGKKIVQVKQNLFFLHCLHMR